MAISRRALVASMLGWGLVSGREALALAGEPFPVFESDAQEIPFKFRRKAVDYATSEPAGTIVVDPQAHYLYLVQDNGMAIRYGVGVGKQGFAW